MSAAAAPGGRSGRLGAREGAAAGAPQGEGRAGAVVAVVAAAPPVVPAALARRNFAEPAVPQGAPGGLRVGGKGASFSDVTGKRGREKDIKKVMEMSGPWKTYCFSDHRHLRLPTSPPSPSDLPRSHRSS